jgi:hypothetical protein
MYTHVSKCKNNKIKLEEKSYATPMEGRVDTASCPVTWSFSQSACLTLT